MAKTKAKKFPYSMFQLTAAFNIKEIVLVEKAMTKGWSSEYERTGYAADAKGKHHRLYDLFETRDDAVAFAEKALTEQEARLKKSKENLAKRRANLAKAKS